MPNFRCEFEALGDFTPAPSERLVRVPTDDGFTFQFIDGDKDEDGHVIKLKIVVTGPADSLEEAQATLRERLAKFLDKLSFVTNSRFSIEGPIVLMEWDEHQKERRYIVYKRYDSRYPPDAVLDDELLGMSAWVDQTATADYVDRSLKHYRLGLLEKQPNDQHTQFWRALEIVAGEVVKKNVDTPRECEACKKELTCNNCGKVHMQPPIARELIGGLMTALGQDPKGEVFKRQYMLRNHITHGRKKDPKCSPADQLVDELEKITRLAIFGAVFGTGKSVGLLQRESVMNMNLTFNTVMLMNYDGVEPHPDIRMFTIPQIKMTVKPRSE